MKEIVLANPIFMDTQIDRIYETYQETGIDKQILSGLANYKLAITEDGLIFEIKVRNDKIENACYGADGVKAYCKLFGVKGDDLKVLTTISINIIMKNNYSEAQWREIAVLMANIEDSNSEATLSVKFGYPMSAVAKFCTEIKQYAEILSKRCCKPIGLMQYQLKRFQVVEDNSGGLTLFVFDKKGNVEYAHDGYEYEKGQLIEDLKEIRKGADPKMEWEGDFQGGNNLEISDQQLYEQMVNEAGSNVICDNNGLYMEKMGDAGRQEFNVNKN